MTQAVPQFLVRNFFLCLHRIDGDVQFPGNFGIGIFPDTQSDDPGTFIGKRPDGIFHDGSRFNKKDLGQKERFRFQFLNLRCRIVIRNLILPAF